jgi:hypothetical protein
MIIDDFDLFRIAILLDETDPPLGVDPHRMLALAIARQLFQPIARRGPKIIQRPGRVDQGQQLLCATNKLCRKTLSNGSSVHCFGPLVPERPDHSPPPLFVS